MQRFFLILFLSLVVINASAQDSLRHIIETSREPHKKIDAIISLAAQLTTKDFDQSIAYANKGMQMAIALNDSVSIGKLERILGAANYFNGKYDIAAACYYRSIQILEKQNDKHELGVALTDLAKLYRKTKDLDKADIYYDRALKIFTSINDSEGIQMVWNESGVVYEYRGEYEEAIRRYKKSLAIGQQRNDSLGVSYSLNFIAGVYIIQKKFDEAEKYLNECLQIRTLLHDTFSIALAHSDMGAMYAAKNDYDHAYNSYNLSNELANKMEYLELLSANYLQMSDLARSSGKDGLAYEYLKKGEHFKDSIYSIQKANQIAELSTRYETEKKEQQLQLQQISLSRKNYIILGISLLMALAGLLAYSYYNRYKLRQEAAMQIAIRQQQDIATKAVIEAEEKERQRIAQDLHDGVGQMMSAVKLNLSAFQSDIEENDIEVKHKLQNIFSLVDDSCREVRNVSHNMMPNALLKSGLEAALREFLNKIDNRILEVNLYSEALDQKLDTDIEIMMYRVIQECVNNVVKHAHASRLDISIAIEDTMMTTSIEDNGNGFDTTNPQTFSGIGLKNITSRVHYLKGEIEFDSAPGRGTVVIINIPLI